MAFFVIVIDTQLHCYCNCYLCPPPLLLQFLLLLLTTVQNLVIASPFLSEGLLSHPWTGIFNIYCVTVLVKCSYIRKDVSMRWFNTYSRCLQDMRRGEEAVMLAANLTFPESIIIKVWTQLSCCKDIKHSCSNPKIGNNTKLSVAGSS